MVNNLRSVGAASVPKRIGTLRDVSSGAVIKTPVTGEYNGLVY